MVNETLHYNSNLFAAAISRRRLSDARTHMDTPVTPEEWDNHLLPTYTLLVRELLDDPSKAVDKMRKLHSISNRRMLQLQNQPEDLINIILEASLTTVEDNLPGYCEDLIKVTNSAVKLSTEIGLTPEEIFDDESEYQDLMRATFSVEEFMARQNQYLQTSMARFPNALRIMTELTYQRFSQEPTEDPDEDPIKRAARKFARKMIPVPSRPPEEETEREIYRVVSEQSIEGFNKIKAEVTRFWGAEGLRKVQGRSVI